MKETAVHNIPIQALLLSGRSRRTGSSVRVAARTSLMMKLGTASLWLVLGLTAGCGRRGDLPIAKAGGVVTIDNKPLANAHVIFTPDTGRAAIGQTTGDGSFTLTTYRSGDGAIVGHHRVTVVAREAGDGQLDRPGAPGIERPGRSLIPEKYANTGTSGLAFDVSAERDNTSQIQLSSKSQ